MLASAHQRSGMVPCAEDAPLQPLTSGLALLEAAHPTADNPMGPMGAQSVMLSQPGAGAVPRPQPPVACPAGPPPGDYHQQVS